MAGCPGLLSLRLYQKSCTADTFTKDLRVAATASAAAGAAAANGATTEEAAVAGAEAAAQAVAAGTQVLRNAFLVAI